MITLHLDNDIIQSLNKSELIILNYVYEHLEEILSISIHDFSKQISYSTATILRFCKKLGYSGFAELKFALKQETSQTKEMPSKVNTTKNILSNLYNDIESTAAMIQETSLKSTIDILSSNRPIHLFNSGGLTGIQINYFEKLLLSIGRQRVYEYSASQLVEHIVRHLSSEDTLVVISSRGDYAPTARLVKLALMNGVTIIAITPYTKNSIANLATINFRFFSNQRENEGAEYTSRLPIFYIIDLIIKSYLKTIKLKEESI
ncbi:MAG: MurR/RpiR family transcriptional regulator [Longicatena sp.]